LAPSRHARINSIAAMIEKQRFRLVENTRQRSSNWSASAAGGAMIRSERRANDRFSAGPTTR
jgi:hypothetical protein